MSAIQWMLSKVGHRDEETYRGMVQAMAREHGVSERRIKADMYRNIVTRGCGYTDYFRGEYFGASREQKDTYVTTRSFYRLLAYLNDEGFANVMRDKLLFCDVFRPYLGRDFINLRVASVEEFAHFIAGKASVFAKKEFGFRSMGVEKVDVSGIEGEDAARELYERLRSCGQHLVEETIEQVPEVDELNPGSVASLRVVTLVKDDRAHLLGATLRMNTREADCTDLHDVLFGMLGADGTFERAPVDGLGRSFEVHPATGKRFDEVRIPGARDAFDLCLRAALEVPQVRYVGWDVAFSRRGSILMEGNAYPSYHLLQFNKLTGRTTGHLKDVADVLGDEMRDIKL